MASLIQDNERNTDSEAQTIDAPLPPREDLATGPTRIGKYLVVGELGKGGQGLVFRGLHPTLNRDVAIKWSLRPLSSADGNEDRLGAEGKMLAQLDHPGIVRVFDLDTHQGRPFLVMEFVRGCDLAQYVRQQPLGPDAAARLVAEVARAVQAAHRQGITHQDIKPQNILIDEAGRPRLSDFGIARLRDLWAVEADQPIGGTLGYMAPEQLAGDPDRIGPRSDVYALGGVLYFLLTGQEPRMESRDMAKIARQVLHGELDETRLAESSAPERLKNVCRKALAPKPEDRYRSCRRASERARWRCIAPAGPVAELAGCGGGSPGDRRTFVGRLGTYTATAGRTASAPGRRRNADVVEGLAAHRSERARIPTADS